MAATSNYTSWLQQPGQEWTTGTKYSAQTPDGKGYWCSAVELNLTDNGAYKMYSQACYIDVYCGSTKIGTASWTGGSGERSNKTITIPYAEGREGKQLHYTMTQSGIKNAIMEKVTVSNVPWCTAQSVINSVDKPSGSSFTVGCNYPTWINSSGSTIKYEWFCGKETVYVTGNRVGTTTSPTFTYTENILLSKGATEGDTIYFYVRSTATKDGTIYYMSGRYPTPQASGVYAGYKTVKIYTGGQWVECIPFVYSGGTWVQSEPYEYHNGVWVECSH